MTPTAYDLSPDEVITAEFLDTYNRGMAHFFSELVELNVNLFILEKVLTFPFAMFSSPHETIFFSAVARNFFRSSLLLVTKAATDRGGDFFTLVHFKTLVRQGVRDEFRAQVDHRLREAKFDRRVLALLEKARNMRSESVAHAIEGVVLGQDERARLDFGELCELRDELNLLLDALSFNVGHMWLPVPYSSEAIHPKGSDSRPDIERILDEIARTSYLLNLPEQNPGMWALELQHRSSEDIKTLSKYRDKFGLPSIE